MTTVTIKTGARRTTRWSLGVTVLAAAALAMSACSAIDTAPQAAPEPAAARPEVTGPRITVTYVGGLLVLDRDSLQPVADIPAPGFLRLNPAGDQRHLMVSTAEGFQVLDTGVEVRGHGDHYHYYAGDAVLTDIVYPAPEPGHVVRHDGRTAMFSDGTGAVHVIDPQHVAQSPAAPTWTAPQPHHGVAVPLPDDGLLVSVGSQTERTGAQVLDADRRPVAASDRCPGLHGEAVAGSETVVVGCTDGVLVWADGTFTKIDSPDPYGRIGNQAGSPHSAVVLGDYKSDPDAKHEEPTRISLVDTTAARIRLVDLGTSYSFRSLGRGPEGEALVLGTDGRLHVIDPDSGRITRRIEVTKAWQQPEAWQDPRPTLMVEGNIAWVTEPSSLQIHVVHLPSGKVVDTVDLPKEPNEISGVGEESHAA